MDSFFWLVLLCISMFTGSFLAGSVPLAFTFSEDRLKIVSTFGAGLLVGTALDVILPEGVETLYSVRTNLIAAMHATEHVGKGGSESDNNGEGARSADPHIAPPTKGRRRAAPVTSTDDHKLHAAAEHQIEGGGEVSAHDHNHGSHDEFEPHKYIGPALTLGFAFMFLIDTIGNAHGSHKHSGPAHIHLSDFREGVMVSPGNSGNGGSSGPSGLADRPLIGLRERGEQKAAATLGLVVHAAADGIALGAASASGRGSLELVVFIAIMLHKAPAAFGLATFLLHEGRSRRTIRNHLLIFSFAAPIGAILTYFLLKQGFFITVETEIPSSTLSEAEVASGYVSAATAAAASLAVLEDQLAMQKWTGILLLFSAGTFLYVATMHILPEIYTSPSHGSNGSKDAGANGGYLGSSQSSPDHNLGWVQVVALLAGMFTPFVLAVEHSH
ncbi:ZIP zinc transporter-domain-containing protein [Cladochytrium replicatum]|nr:ZIP zinc transporter-domain-containing protein [Cladochytrium replicatum]